MAVAWFGDMIDLWADWMWACTWQVLILIAVVGIADRMLRGKLWPHLFMCLWTVVLLKLILPPFVSSPISVSYPLLGDTGAPFFIEPIVRFVIRLGCEPSAALKTTLFVIWLGGVAVFASFYLIQYCKTKMRLRLCATAPKPILERAESIAHEMDIRPGWQIKVCDRGPMPGMFGVRRPILVLPTDIVCSANPSDLQSILVHEFAHVRRGDAAFRLLIHSILILYWFNPALILMRRRLAALQEICCDATAMSFLGKKRGEYIATLLQMGRRLLDSDVRREPVSLISVFDSESGLDERIRRLKIRRTTLSSRQRRLIGILVLIAFKLTVFPMGDPQAVAAYWQALGL